jgi:hypothetical protein
MLVMKAVSRTRCLIENFVKADCLILVNVVANTNCAVDHLGYSLGAVKGFTSVDDRHTHFVPQAT